MAIVVEQKFSFTPMPEGLHAAVIAEVKDLGMRPSPYGEKHQVVARLVDAEGREASRFYTPSLHEKATLAKDLVVLTGGIPAKLDMESLVGTQCQVLVTEKIDAKGRKGAKVEKIMKPKAGQKVPMPKAKAAAPATKAPAAPAARVPEYSQEITDDDIPF